VYDTNEDIMKERLVVPADLRKSKDVDRKLDRFMRDYDKFEERQAIAAPALRKTERNGANTQHLSPPAAPRGFPTHRVDDFNPRFVKIDSGLSDAGTDNRMIVSHNNDSLVLVKPVKPPSTAVTSLSKKPVQKQPIKQTSKHRPAHPSLDQHNQQPKYPEPKLDDSQLSISSSDTRFLAEDNQRITSIQKKRSVGQNKAFEATAQTRPTQAKEELELNKPRYIKVKVDGGQNVYLTRSEYLAYNLAAQSAKVNEKGIREKTSEAAVSSRQNSLHKRSEPNVELITNARHDRSRKNEFDRSSEFDGSRVTAKPFAQLRHKQKQLQIHRSVETQTEETKPHLRALSEKPHVVVQTSLLHAKEQTSSVAVKKSFEMGTQTNRSVSQQWESSDRDTRKSRQLDKMTRTGKSIEQMTQPVIEKVTLPSINKYSQPK